ncbi:MAG: hypothetical protein MZV63_18480 [Marinilabiliales bacterium]|nr:hypothetical protein [Marinilabiliales bacterium]
MVNDGAGIIDISKALRIIVHPRITGNLVGADTTLCYQPESSCTLPAQCRAGRRNRTIFHYSWEQSPDNLTWSNAAGTNTNRKYDPLALTATAYYHRVVSSGACTDVSTPVTITILPVHHRQHRGG